MPYYDFLDEVNHLQELKMTFAEHAKLESDTRGIYIPCNAKFGDKDMPNCPYRAYQQFDKNVGLKVN